MAGKRYYWLKLQGQTDHICTVRVSRGSAFG